MIGYDTGDQYPAEWDEAVLYCQECDEAMELHRHVGRWVTFGDVDQYECPECGYSEPVEYSGMEY